MEKNQEKTGTVIAVGSNGEGILYEDTYVVFLPFSYIGEKARYKVLKVVKNLVYGKVIEVITPSKERVKPVCPVYQKCGGCHISHLTYSAQLKVKENNVKFLPLYMGVEGEESQGLCIGTENFICIKMLWQLRSPHSTRASDCL